MYMGLQHAYIENTEYYSKDFAGTTEPIKAG
jgi:hypothetical protein